MSLDGTYPERSIKILRVDLGGRVAHGLGGGGQGRAYLGGGCFQRGRRHVGDLSDDFSLGLDGVLLDVDDGALRVEYVVDHHS